MHNGVVQSYRKKNGPFFLLFPFEAGFDFFGNPITFDRVFGKEKEQFVMEAYGLINTLTETISDLEVLGSQPAAHAFVLKIRMELVSKFLISGRIADEAGIQLTDLVKNGRQVLNQMVRKSAASKKL
jgi:hypothetical protein